MNMSEKPLISIIVPVYKVEKYLLRCVHSIINQTYKNLEIILVDDGSPDNCPQLCEQLAKIDNRIVVLHKENAGVSSARNLGLRYATGSYIAFVDSDDYVAENMYEELVNVATQNSADAVFCGYSMVDEQEQILSICQPYESLVNDSRQALKQVIGAVDGNMFYGTGPWNKLIKKSIIDGIYFDETISVSEDAIFLVDVISRCSRVSFVADALYYYVQRSGSAYHTSGITKQRVDNLKAWVRIRKKLSDSSELKNRTEYNLFNDGFPLLIEAYIDDKNEYFDEIYDLTMIGKSSWMKNNGISARSKLKAMLILILMNLQLSKKVVKKISEVH